MLSKLNNEKDTNKGFNIFLCKTLNQIENMDKKASLVFSYIYNTSYKDKLNHLVSLLDIKHKTKYDEEKISLITKNIVDNCELVDYLFLKLFKHKDSICEILYPLNIFTFFKLKGILENKQLNEKFNLNKRILDLVSQKDSLYNVDFSINGIINENYARHYKNKILFLETLLLIHTSDKKMFVEFANKNIVKLQDLFPFAQIWDLLENYIQDINDDENYKIITDRIKDEINALKALIE